MADPGFSRGGGREPSRGGVNTPNFPENCMKSKEFGRPGGGVRPSRPPLDPPMTASVILDRLYVIVYRVDETNCVSLNSVNQDKLKSALFARDSVILSFPGVRSPC